MLRGAATTILGKRGVFKVFEGNRSHAWRLSSTDGGSLCCRLSSSCIMTTLGERSALWNRRQPMLTGTMCIIALARYAGTPVFRAGLMHLPQELVYSVSVCRALKTFHAHMHYQSLRAQESSTKCMPVHHVGLLTEQLLSQSLIAADCTPECAPCMQCTAIPKSAVPHTKRVQVFRHRTYGYRGVIYGWDRSCERDLNWTEKFNVDADQPFYWVLPDEVDCQRLFGGVRISKYVAQVQPLHTLNLISAHGFAQDETHGSISCASSERCGYQGMERRYS